MVVSRDDLMVIEGRVDGSKAMEINVDKSLLHSIMPSNLDAIASQT
jgi:hypothetical protein